MSLIPINTYTVNITISSNQLDYFLENENILYLASPIANRKIDNEEQKSSEMTDLKDFEVIYTPEYVSKNITTLQKKFRKEILKKKISPTSEEGSKAYNIFSATSSFVAELPFNKATTELTKSGSIKYTLLFQDGKTLMISKPFEKLDDVDTNQVIFSIFQNQELILSNVAKISDLVQSFNELFPL